jgi:lysine/ornithine N-monooxygenase
MQLYFYCFLPGGINIVVSRLRRCMQGVMAKDTVCLLGSGQDSARVMRDLGNTLRLDALCLEHLVDKDALGRSRLKE